MSSTGAGYDASASTFSPDGRIFQVEYAQKAVENSGTAIGIRCRDGVVLGVEKVQLSKMMLHGSNKRIYHVDRHAGIAVTGVSADGRQVVDRARDEAESYRETYGHRIPPSALAGRLGLYVHYFTLHGSLRPFGCSVLIACFDEETRNHELYAIDPSGTTLRFFGIAVGKGTQAAKTELEKLPLNEMSCREAMREIARIVHTIKDPSKDKPFELEMSWLSEETNWQHEIVPRAEVEAIEAEVKAQLDQSEPMRT